MLFESEKSRELHIPNMYAFGRGEFLDQTVVLFMFPSSNSKDGCFSGKRCIGATPAGNDNSFRDVGVID